MSSHADAMQSVLRNAEESFWGSSDGSGVAFFSCRRFCSVLAAYLFATPVFAENRGGTLSHVVSTFPRCHMYQNNVRCLQLSDFAGTADSVQERAMKVRRLAANLAVLVDHTVIFTR